MKNYNKFIYEQNTFDGFDVDEIVKVIQEDCKPYLDKFDTALFRGMNINSEDSAVFSLFDRFKHREPRTTSIEAHTVLDNVFNEEFGWKARSEGVFVDQNFGNEYGSGLYLFFPRGDFDYLWSPKVEDLLSYVEYSLYDFTYKSYLEDISNGDHIYYDYAKGLIKKKWCKKMNNIQRFEQYQLTENDYITVDNVGEELKGDWSIFKVDFGKKMFISSLYKDSLKWNKFTHKYSDVSTLKLSKEYATKVALINKDRYITHIGIVNDKGVQEIL